MTKRGRPRHPDVLTPREWEVLSLIRDGLTNEQIAERMGVTIHAARYHVSQILSKLGVATREEAAAWQGEPVEASGRWLRALQIGLALGAACVIVAVGVLAWGVTRGSGDDEAGVIASPSPSATPLLSEPATPTQIPAETPPPGFVGVSRPDVGATVRSMQLTDDTGFVLTDDALLRSPFIRDGERVDIGPPVDITPPGVAITDIRGFRFLDGQRGWLVASGTITNPDANDGTSSLQLLVFRTTDGGESWQTSPLADAFIYFEARYDRGSIDFLNTERGWVVIDTRVTMNSATGHLFRTDDGGQTWTQLTAVAGDPVYFVDDNNGWQAVSPCSTCPVSKLYVTHDGGQTWTDASDITPQAQPAGPRAFGHPVAVDGGRLLLPVTMYIQGHPSLFMLYSSTDGGQTWPQVVLTEAGDRISEGYAVPTYIFADGSAVVFAPDGAAYQLAPGATEFESFTAMQLGDIRDPFTPTGLFPIERVNFLDRQHGWALVGDGGCVQFKSDCWQATFIEQTEDGGNSWSLLRMPGTTPTPLP